MNVGCVMSGRELSGVMVWAPPPPMLKLIVPPPVAFLSSIAARSVHSPIAVWHTASPGTASGSSPAELTTNGGGVAPGLPEGAGVAVRVAVAVGVGVQTPHGVGVAVG